MKKNIIMYILSLSFGGGDSSPVEGFCVFNFLIKNLILY